MARLTAEFSSAFSRDLKRITKRRDKDLSQLENVIELILSNTPESRQALSSRHNMHTLSGKWSGHNECHIANAGDWLLIWASNDKVAFFERTGSHDQLFR